VGRALFQALPSNRFQHGAVLSHSLTSARHAVRLMGEGSATEDPESLAPSSVILIAVPDRVIPEVAARLAAAKFSYTKKLVLHTGLASTSAALESLAKRGAAVGTLCPVCLFQNPMHSYRGIHFLVEGDELAVRAARKLVQALGGEFNRIKPEDKHHNLIALTMVSDLITGVLELAVLRMNEAGLSRKRSISALRPVVSAAVQDFAQSHSNSRPGPILGPADDDVAAWVAAVRKVDGAGLARLSEMAKLVLAGMPTNGSRLKLLDANHDEPTNRRRGGAAADLDGRGGEKAARAPRR
jgi:predicted short-subunit dehydrogenase-like oxidoreductase (DUF2520 family)